MKKFIIKSYEEECGNDYWVVFVPDEIEFDTVMEKLKMAAKYANLCTLEENRTDYDKHFEEMFEYRENSNGEDTFNHYITQVCGWEINPLAVDFKYEW